MAKHGVLGSVRSLHSALAAAELDVRVNGIASNWTVTGMVPQGEIPCRSEAC
jgi:NAD(P)-dependent dehydrogenase (short-subunit alcohol dehydrogenase family)